MTLDDSLLSQLITEAMRSIGNTPTVPKHPCRRDSACMKSYKPRHKLHGTLRMRNLDVKGFILNLALKQQEKCSGGFFLHQSLNPAKGSMDPLEERGTLRNAVLEWIVGFHSVPGNAPKSIDIPDNSIRCNHNRRSSQLSSRKTLAAGGGRW